MMGFIIPLTFSFLLSSVASFSHPSSLLYVAEKAAKKAGELIAASPPSLMERKANSRDLLTQTDLASEKLIKQMILDHFPGHQILGEEDVSPGSANSAKALADALETKDEYLWIVDPLDGTTNFIHNLCHSAPSVAVIHVATKKTIAGAIFDPWRNELFSAELGKGAFFNGEKLVKDDEDDIKLGDTLVAMGSPPASESMKMSMLGATALMPKVRSLRMTGSAALMLAYVGVRRFGAYWEYDLSSWDVAAGNLFIREAGGGVMTIDSGSAHTLTDRQILAHRSSGESMAESLRQILNDAGVV